MNNGEQNQYNYLKLERIMNDKYVFWFIDRFHFLSFITYGKDVREMGILVITIHDRKKSCDQIVLNFITYQRISLVGWMIHNKIPSVLC